MKIAHINMMTNGSTGKIMLGLAERARQYGYEAYTFSVEFFCKGKKPDYKKIKYHQYFGFYWESFLHTAFGRLTGLNGLFSWFGTIQLISKLKKIGPDIIHLHNIHSYCICIPLFFRYVKKNNVRVVWTFHDCWPVTGRCPNFEMIGCKRWKNGCYACPQKNSGYKSFFELSSIMWKLKKRWLTSIDDMIIVTPSQWLANIVKQSYLKHYPVKVINNGIDLNIFKPTSNDFKIQHRIQNKYMVLGVAFDWGERKGVDVCIELSRQLGDQYQIVLVGTNSFVDRILPESILSIHRTQNQQELAKTYSAADVFINPTREDNYPTVNIESLACGTPVITFNSGGSSEIINSHCGISIKKNDIKSLADAVRKVCLRRPFSREDCVARADELSIDKSLDNYMKIYKATVEQK